MAWKERLKKRDESRVAEHVIPCLGEEPILFYPNRLASLSQLREMSGEISVLLGHLFNNSQNDAATSVKKYQEPLPGGGFATVEETSVDASSVDVLQFRCEERQEVIKQVFELLNGRNILYMGRLFMDSMRDEFKYKRERSAKEIEEFLYGDNEGEGALDFELIVAVMTGWLKGNAKQFGDMGKKLLELFQDKLKSLQSESNLEDQTDSGNSSETPSQPQSDGDTLTENSSD